MAKFLFQKGNKYGVGRKFNLGRKHSDISKKNMSDAHKGYVTPEATKINMRLKHLGRKYKPMSKQGRENIRLAMKGKYAGEKNYFWKGGLSYEPYSVEWTETLKKSIRERDHYICQLCSKDGYPVHHIDYDKKNCDPKNLITLCEKCHRKTNDNRNYWITYFKNKLFSVIEKD